MLLRKLKIRGFATKITTNHQQPEQASPARKTDLIRVLTGLPCSLQPIDVRGIVTKLTQDKPKQIIYLPDQSIPSWTQSNILFFSNEEEIKRIEENIKIKSNLTPVLLTELIIGLTRLDKHQFAFNYLKSIAVNHHLDHLLLNPRDALIPLRSGQAVLISGLPVNSNPTQVENTIFNFGFPIIKAKSIDPTERMKSSLYWPFLDPSPTCISNKLLQTRINKPNSPITRSQLIYTPSISISNFIVGELHQSRPTWLGHRKLPASKIKNSTPNTKTKASVQPSSDGWKLKARVIF